MQLSSSRQPRQAKQDLGPVSPLLCPEEDNGLAGFEAAAAQAHQHGFFVTNPSALYAQISILLQWCSCLHVIEPKMQVMWCLRQMHRRQH